MTHEEREALRGLCEDAWFIYVNGKTLDSIRLVALLDALDEAEAERDALDHMENTLFAEKLDLLSQLELMRLRAEKAEKENLSRELGSFEEHRDLHYWRDEARKYKARAEAAEARAEA